MERGSGGQGVQMFRMIALVRLKAGIDPEPIAEAVRANLFRDPNVRSGEVVLGFGHQDKTSEVPLHTASYSVLLDFDDEASWRLYLAGEPHASADEVAVPYVDSVMATHYIVPN